MSRSPHPLLDRLHRGAGTMAQLLAGAQAAQAVLDVMGGGLQRVGFDVDDPWARLLDVPLEARPSGLQAALDHLAAADVPPEATAVATRAQRASLASAGVQPARAAQASAAADVTRRASRLPAGMPTQQPARRPPLSAAAATPRAAAAAWQQRAAAAGVEDAFFSPLRERTRWRATAPLPTPAGTPQPALAPASPRPWPADDATATAYATASLVQRAEGPAPVLVRLNSALDRIEGRSAAAPAERMRPASQPSNHDAGMRAAGAVGLPLGRNLDADAAHADAAARWASPQRDAIQQASNAVAGSARGFRGLAARAAAAAASSLPSLPPTASPPAGAAAPDDERLSDQLARLLRREAERDGIDTSDIAP